MIYIGQGNPLPNDVIPAMCSGFRLLPELRIVDAAAHAKRSRDLFVEVVNDSPSPFECTARRCFAANELRGRLDLSVSNAIVAVFLSQYVKAKLRNGFPVMYCPNRAESALCRARQRKRRKDDGGTTVRAVRCMDHGCVRPSKHCQDDNDWNLLAFWLMCLGVNKTGSALLRPHEAGGDPTPTWLIDPSEVLPVPCSKRRDDGWLSLLESERAMTWLRRTDASLEDCEKTLNAAWGAQSQDDLTLRALHLVGSRKGSVMETAIHTSCVRMLRHAQECISRLRKMHDLTTRCRDDAMARRFRMTPLWTSGKPHANVTEDGPDYGAPLTPEAQRCGEQYRRREMARRSRAPPGSAFKPMKKTDEASPGEYWDGIEPHRWLSISP